MESSSISNCDLDDVVDIFSTSHKPKERITKYKIKIYLVRKLVIRPLVVKLNRKHCSAPFHRSAMRGEIVLPCAGRK